MKKKKKPRFFCDNCGCEVNNSVKSCPQCGRYFASVRCPSCGFTGEEKLFNNGCPSCGYSNADTQKHTPSPRRKKSSAAFPPQHSNIPWTYIVSGIILLVIVAALAFIITR